MADSLPTRASGFSPAFPIAVQDFKLWHVQWLTRIGLDGVEPPLFGPGGGASQAMQMRNLWFPWIDEPIVIPKYDGIGQYVGMPSNRPTLIKDYHTIALMRAVDRILAPVYVGRIVGRVGTVKPSSAPRR